MASFRILGAIEVVDGDRRLEVGGRRQLVLLSYLLLHADRVVSHDVLSDAVWGPARSGVRNRLPMAIARLRSALEPVDRDGRPRVVTASGGYMLSLGTDELDADLFAAGVRDGRRALKAGDAAGAAAVLGRALSLWRGPPLAEVSFEDFAQAEIRRLEELWLVAVEARVDADLALGLHAEVIAELEALVTEHPTRERLAAQLMTALYRCGRQADALGVYRRTRAYLADQLGLVPGPALRALEREILEQAPSLHADLAAPVVGSLVGRSPRPLPLAPSAIVGRAGELDTVRGLFASPDVRVVTLTGVGGVGKTRLALELAHVLAPEFPDGACWVELASVTRPEDVASTVLRALAVLSVQGESADRTLQRHLAGKRLLLAIDNFEHVLAASQLISEVHGACPELKMLITSREALDIACEHRVVVAPLGLPPLSASVSVAEIESADASALFVAAARRRDSRFSVTADIAPAIARICGRLDGLPLALELAAARTGALSVDELAGRLDHSAWELGSGVRDAPVRQRTLRATIEWSHSLLDPDQQRAFARFAVFAGGATLEAAETVTAAPCAAIELLIAKSLLDRRRAADGSTRLVMLETVREYARERLGEDPEHRAVVEARYRYYLGLVESAFPRRATYDDFAALATIDDEIDNLLQTLEWALEQAPNDALRLATALSPYWCSRGDLDGLPWLERALLAAGDQAPADLAARALLAKAWLLPYRMEFEAAIEAATAALDLYRAGHEHAGISEACHLLALITGVWDRSGRVRLAEEACAHARLAGDDVLLGRALLTRASALPADQCLAALEQAAQLLPNTGSRRQIAIAYNDAAWAAVKESRPTEALALLDIALPMAERARASQITMAVLGSIGLASLLTGDLERARASHTRQLQLCQSHASPYAAAEGLAGLAAVSAAGGHYATAARLLGAARALGYPPPGDEAIDDRLEREYIAPARARFGTDAWRREQELGATLSYEQAIDVALAEPGQSDCPPLHEDRSARGLTPQAPQL